MDCNDLAGVSKMLRKELAKDPHYLQALGLAQTASLGRVWLIGSVVYKNIFNVLSRGDESSVRSNDYDFLVDEVHDEIFLPEGFFLGYNVFDSPKITCPDFKVDLVRFGALRNLGDVEEGGRMINDYLESVPLNLWSIAYNPLDNRVVGRVGLTALEDQVIRIHNSQSARRCAEVSKGHLCRKVEKIREELGFGVEGETLLNLLQQSL